MHYIDEANERMRECERMYQVLPEHLCHGKLEEGWYVVNQNNEVVSGPHTYLWRANEAMRNLESK